MGARSDLIEVLKSWVNRTDLSPAVVGTWITMCEERMNRDLRVLEMIERDYATLLDNAAPFPLDALDIDYVRFMGQPDDNADITSGKPLEFTTNDEFWRRADPGHDKHNIPRHTIIGRQLFIFPISAGPNGTTVEIGYYNTIPPLAEDTGNWLYKRWQTAYIYGSLVHSATFLMEDERIATWEGLTDKFITTANNAAIAQKFGGGPLRVRSRRFG